MLANRRAKIVATIGPASQSRENLKKCLQAGMNVARLNFSHGTQNEHQQVIKNLRELSEEMQAPLSILQDLQGPKIRVGMFENGFIDLAPNAEVTLTVKKVMGREGLISCDFEPLMNNLKIGAKVLMDDGLIELKVLGVNGQEARCQVIFGGTLKNRKGMNCPGVHLSIECMTAKDLSDLEFGLQQNVDYIALSFVRYGKDIRALRDIIDSKKSVAKICAKIEMEEAIENLEEIVRLSDCVMVARGDLAVELGQTRLPGLQKRIITLCNELNKPVITATQMLDSMVNNPTPTRAEITDVANAVLDGTDALMLSAESASGKYPFKCLQTMHEIILEVETNQEKYYKLSLEKEYLSVSGSIAASSALSALKLDAKVIVCLTTTGKTAIQISGLRPKARILAVTDKMAILNRLELTWGLQTLIIKPYQKLEDVVEQLEKVLIEMGLAKTGDSIILTLGQPMRQGHKTNSLFIFTMGGANVQKLPEQDLPLRYQTSTRVGDLPLS